MDAGKKLMYECAGVKLIYEKTMNRYTVSSAGTTYNTSNPLEAWCTYWNRVDSVMRRKIGNLLEKQGLNRYSGEEQLSMTDQDGV